MKRQGGGAAALAGARGAQDQYKNDTAKVHDDRREFQGMGSARQASQSAPNRQKPRGAAAAADLEHALTTSTAMRRRAPVDPTKRPCHQAPPRSAENLLLDAAILAHDGDFAGASGVALDAIMVLGRRKPD